MNEPTDATSTSERWKHIINITPEYAAHRTQFFNILGQFQELLDCHLEKINTAAHGVELSSPEAGPIHAVPYSAHLKKREAEKEEFDKVLRLNFIECTQTECASPILFVSKQD